MPFIVVRFTQQILFLLLISFLLCSFVVPSNRSVTPGGHDRKIIITGYITKVCPRDTITLNVHGDITTQQSDLNIDSVITYITDNGHFRFVISDAERPVYLSISSSSSREVSFNRVIPYYTFRQYLIRPGDSIHINTNWRYCQYSGRGAERFTFLDELARLRYLKALSLPLTTFINNAGLGIQFVRNGEIKLAYDLAVLENARKQISHQDYLDLKANITAFYRETIYRYFQNLKFGLADKKYGDTLLVYYGRHYYQKSLDTSHRYLNPDAAFYNNYAYIKTVTDSLYEQIIQTPVDKRELFADIDYMQLFIRKFKGRFLDKMLYTYMLIRVARSSMTEAQFTSMIKLVKTPGYLAEVQNYAQRYESGKPVTDFSFEDSNGKKVTLDDFKGKVVFVDIWFTGCGGCVDVARALPAVERVFEHNKEVVFISLSIDKQKNYWKASINPDTLRTFGSERYTHYTTDSTIYLYTEGKGYDHDFIQKYVPTNAYPKLMLIDRNGKLFSASPPRPATEKSNNELISLINLALKE